MADLPPYTIEIARLFNAPAEAEGYEARYRAEHKALLKVLGKEGLAEVAGSDKFERCDLSALEAEFLRVKEAYEKPQADAQRDQIAKVSEMVGSLDLDKLAKTFELLDRPSVRKGFRAV